MDFDTFVLKICCFMFVLGSCSVQAYDLQFVQILWRHGDRAPIELYPTDPNPATFWTVGLSQLTELGKKQHYMFGGFLRKKYANFITSSPLEVKILSSDLDRCKQSALSNVASFFEPRDNWKFMSNVDWQPIALDFVPQNIDLYLETDSYCPAADEEEERVAASPAGQQFLADHMEMFSNLSYYSGNTITNWTDANYLHDALFIEKKYGLIMPEWVDPYWEELSEVSNSSFFWSFSTPLLRRLRAGPLIGLMVNKMKSKIADKLGQQKVQIYSAHDTNVAAILNAFDLFDMNQPPYCAAVVVELYKDNENNHFVRLLYYNSSTPEQGDQAENVLVLHNCSEYCPFEFLLNYTKDLIPRDWYEECRTIPPLFRFSDNGVITVSVITVIVLVLIILAYFVFAKFCCNRKDNTEYSYQLMTAS